MLAWDVEYIVRVYPELDELLNKRTEVISKCRHQNKFLLMNFKVGLSPYKNLFYFRQ